MGIVLKCQKKGPYSVVPDLIIYPFMSFRHFGNISLGQLPNEFEVGVAMAIIIVKILE